MTRVLFVDDEAIVLRTLDRALRAHKPSWTTAQAGSGPEALALLDREPFDVVVSDLSMPGMDGLKLLDRVRANHPQIARLVLSGQVRFEDRIRDGSAVHQWLSKPCPVPRLVAVIDRLQWARSLVDDPQLLALVGEVASLPSAPALHVAVTRALERQADLTEICNLIADDVALSTKLLQLANSSLFFETERITSVQRAAAVLGRPKLAELLATDAFHPGSHATEVAVRAREVATIARSLATEHHDEAFLSGLLQGIGPLVLGPRAATTSPKLQARVSALLAGTWGLPFEVVTAVAFHHDPESAPDPADARLRAVSLASKCATGAPACNVVA